jgi:hypothetical protein
MNNDNTSATDATAHQALFVSALREAVRQYPAYFYVTGNLDQLDSMWDMQPDFHQLESLLLENEATQAFIAAVWSFFRPLSLGQSGFADSTRAMHDWQKQILAQMMLHDPLANTSAASPTPDLNPQTC